MKHTCGLILLFFALSAGICLLGIRGGDARAYVRCVNRSGRDLWVSIPMPVEGASTFEAQPVPSGRTIPVGRDRFSADRTYAVLAYDVDPGPEHVNVPQPIAPIEPVARVMISGDRLVRTDSERPLVIVASAKDGGVTMRVEPPKPPASQDNQAKRESESIVKVKDL